MNAAANKAASGFLAIGYFLALAWISWANELHAQASAVVQPEPPKTMASLLAEGYEMQDIRMFPDKIWMRKSGEAVAYICDRGRIGSPAFEAYRNRKYAEISCSPAP
jgi:hypothetical protein